MAKRYAEEFGIPFVASTVSSVFERLGLDPAASHKFDDRMRVQEAILEELTQLYRAGRSADPSLPGVFISDRTPIDLLAYTYSDITPEWLTPKQHDRLVAYRKACYATLNEFFAVIFTLQPVLPVARSRKGKGSSSPALLAKQDALVRGLAASEDVLCRHFLMPRATVDLDARVECIANTCARTEESYLQTLQRAPEPVVYH